MSAPPLTPNAWLRYDLVGRYLQGRPAPETVLELGMGQGAVGSRLAAIARYTGVEPDDRSRAVAAARLPPTATVLASADDLAPGERFDLVCAFEVLEHIEDDLAALTSWVDRCRPGGWLMLSVPAKQDRFGPMDERVGHFRRYDRRDLVALAHRVGLVDLIADHYGFPLGYVLEAGRNAIARRSPGSGDMGDRTSSSGRLFQPRRAVGVGSMLGSAPFRLLQRPFRTTGLGTGLVLSGRRPAAT